MTALLEKFGYPISYFPLGENKGIAEAQNIGIRESVSAGCSHVLLLDQDSVVSSGMVTKLLVAEGELLKAGKKVAAVGPCVVDENTGARPCAVQYRWLRVHRIDPNADSSEPIETANLMASGSVIRTAILGIVGAMRSDLFIDLVDTEWVFRASSAGYKSYCVPGAFMVHRIGDAARKFFGRDVYLHSDLRYYYILRNALYLAGVRSMGWQWRAYIVSRLPYQFLVYSWFSTDRFGTARVLIKALWDGLVGRLGPLKEELGAQ